MHIDAMVALAGLIVGLAVGMTGMGGGALMTPVLVLLFHVQPLTAVSSDLLASLVMKPFGAGVHIAARTVRWPLVTWLCVGSVPASFCGVLALRAVGNAHAMQTVITLALGSVVMLAVAAMVVKALLDRRRSTAITTSDATPPRRGALIALGVVVGFIVGITSVGSGTLVIITLLFLYPRLRGSQLVGTDLVQAIPMVGAASLAHALFGDLQLTLTVSIILGAVPGTLAGAALSSRISTPIIRAALAVVLVASGLKLLGVPTLAIGIIALAALLIAAIALLVSGRRTPIRIAHSRT